MCGGHTHTAEETAPGGPTRLGWQDQMRDTLFLSFLEEHVHQSYQSQEHQQTESHRAVRANSHTLGLHGSFSGAGTHWAI